MTLKWICLQWKENGRRGGFDNFRLLKRKITCRETSFKVSQRGGRVHGEEGKVPWKWKWTWTFSSSQNSSHSAVMLPSTFLFKVFYVFVKMIELENQIRKETELRNKAEKRLKLLIKKLESLNIASISVISENSTSSEISTNSSATKETEDQESRSEENQSEKAVPDIAAPKQRDEDKTNQNAPDQTNSSPNTESPNNSCTDPHRYSQISRSRDQRYQNSLPNSQNFTIYTRINLSSGLIEITVS